MTPQPETHTIIPPLASEFPATSEEQWRAAVEGVLRGKPFETLVARTFDGIEIQPLYPRYRGARTGIGSARGWHITARVDHPDPVAANAAAKVAVENGATALNVVFGRGIGAYGFGVGAHDAQALETLLDGIHLDWGLPVFMDAGEDAYDLASALSKKVAIEKLDPAATKVHFGIDPIGAAACVGAGEPWSQGAHSFAAQLGELSSSGFGGGMCLADGRVVHNACGSEAQELAYVLGCGVAYLRALDDAGMPLETARRLIDLRLGADADQFTTIAKFRAMRLLWSMVEESCGLPPQRVELGAETAWRMMTRQDPWVNVIRTTLALTAAGLGGADSVTVLPYTQAVGLPDDFARRLARNAQIVLVSESNLDKVADPAAGSGAVEALTDAVADKAWTLFQKIEAGGGIWQNLVGGSFQAEVLATRKQRESDVATLRQPLVGQSTFPLITEKPVTVLEAAPVRVAANRLRENAETLIPLAPVRLSEGFEQLRFHADAFAARNGKRPRVFLANVGDPADFLARANFAEALFGAGGFEATAKDRFEDRDKTIEAFIISGAAIACLCGQDDAYEREAVALVDALRNSGATAVFVAGHPNASEPRLRQAGVSSYVFEGCNVLEALGAAHRTL